MVCESAKGDVIVTRSCSNSAILEVINAIFRNNSLLFNSSVISQCQSSTFFLIKRHDRCLSYIKPKIFVDLLIQNRKYLCNAQLAYANKVKLLARNEK